MRRIISLVIILALALGLITPTASYSLSSVATPDSNISCNSNIGAVIDKNGNLWVWGGNGGDGVLGDGKPGSTSLKPIKLLSRVKFVDVGYFHGAAITENGDLYIWGYFSEYLNDWLPTPAAAYSKPIKVMSGVKSVSCGEASIAIVKENGELWTLGNNITGVVGNGYTGNKAREWYYDAENFVYYPVQTVPVKILDGVVQAKVNDSLGMALKADGSVWTWGGNKYGELGNGGNGDSYTTIRGEGMISCKVQTIPSKILDDIVYIDLGSMHAAAITSKGELLMWGGDNYFRNNFGSVIQNSPIQVMDNVAQVACGLFNTAIVTKNGELFVFGQNRCGQLGNGTTKDVVVPTKVMNGVNSVALYNGCTIIVKNDGSVWTCGNPEVGGSGGKSNSFDEVYNEKAQTVPVKIMDGAKLAERASTPPAPPVDEPSDWAKPIMEKASNAGLIKERLKNNWQKPIPRDEAATIVVSYLEAATGKDIDQILREKKVTINTTAFNDTKDYDVLAVYELGIVTGFPDGGYHPKETLTRAQLAVLLCNTAEVLGINTKGHSSTFTDTVNHWANKFIGWPAYAGIVVGTGNNKFNPDAPLTKEQTIAAFYSMFIMP